MRTVAIIQARMGSTRLPGKVMRRLCGKSVLAHVVERVRACPRVDQTLVATTQSPNDDVLVQECRRLGVDVFRGSEEDVLARYYHAAREAGADLVVRITSDCPLIDTGILGGMLDEFHAALAAGQPLDYMSNSLTRTYPRGLDVEIFTLAALERAFREASRPHEREHVTPYIYQHPEYFVLRGVTSPVDMSKYRWALDTEEDYALLDEIFTALCAANVPVTTAAALALFEQRPELIRINAHVQQKSLTG